MRAVYCCARYMHGQSGSNLHQTFDRFLSEFEIKSSCLRCFSADAQSIFFSPSIAPDREPNAEEQHHETHSFRPDRFRRLVCSRFRRRSCRRPVAMQRSGIILQRVLRQLIADGLGPSTRKLSKSKRRAPILAPFFLGEKIRRNSVMLARGLPRSAANAWINAASVVGQ